MEVKLSFEELPKYTFSGFVDFEPKRRHITRVCTQDVLVMVYDGVLRFEEDGVPVDVSAGEYYIQRRGKHQTGNRESDTPKYYFIHFFGEFSENAAGIPLHGKADFEKLLPLFRALDNARLSGGALLETSAIVYQIFTWLRRGGTGGVFSRVVARIVAQVAQAPSAPFSLAETAKALGYSKNQIINIFKKSTGKSPYAYITEMRIDMAKRMLVNSEASLAEISEACGFGAYINFYKAFVKGEGCSPIVWKRAQLEELQKAQ